MKHCLTSLSLLLCLIATSSTWAKETSHELRKLEQQIEDMKEEVMHHKINLRQLEEAVLFGKLTETVALVTFKHDATDFCEFEAGEFTMNGQTVSKLTKADLSKGKGFATILDGEVPPGKQKLSMKLHFRGKKNHFRTPAL